MHANDWQSCSASKALQSPEADTHSKVGNASLGTDILASGKIDRHVVLRRAHPHSISDAVS
jgi:hypothetical protein